MFRKRNINKRVKRIKSNWEKLEEMCALVGGKEYVWYATNMEIVDYVSAFRSLQRSVNGKIIHNPTDVDVYVVADNKNVFIPKGATVTVG